MIGDYQRVCASLPVIIITTLCSSPPPLPLSSLGHVEECRQLRRDLALACARARDRERALKHSYAILSDAKTRQCSSEVAFLTDLLASLHLDDGDLTRAHNVLAHTIAFLEAPPEPMHPHVRLSVCPPLEEDDERTA